MAKRRSSEETDPFDEPLNGNMDDIDVGDFRMEDAGDIDESLLESPEAGASARAPLTPGQLIVAAIQVIVLAVIVLALFLAIGFGAVFGGQRLGIVPTRPSSAAVTISLLPTSVAGQPTAAPQVAPTPTTALPTLTPDLSCSNAAAWWNSQQVQDNYQYFTQQALNDARDAARLTALLEQMRIRRDFVANFPADPCLSEARDALLSSFDATIDTARAVGSGNAASISQQQETQTQAFAVLTAALWAVNLTVDADSAPAQGVERGSGAACGAQSWYDSVKPQQQAFFTTAQQIDLTTMSESAVRPLIDTMQASRGGIAAVNAPACAAKAQTFLLGALDGYIQALEGQIAARSAVGDFSAYTRQNSLFLAWLAWLGVS